MEWRNAASKFFFFSFFLFVVGTTSLARHSAVSFHSEVQQIAISPFFSLDSLICPPFARPPPTEEPTLLRAPAFQRSTPLLLCRLHVSTACPFQGVLTRRGAVTRGSHVSAGEDRHTRWHDKKTSDLNGSLNSFKFDLSSNVDVEPLILFWNFP